MKTRFEELTVGDICMYTSPDGGKYMCVVATVSTGIYVRFERIISDKQKSRVSNKFFYAYNDRMYAEFITDKNVRKENRCHISFLRIGNLRNGGLKHIEL